MGTYSSYIFVVLVDLRISPREGETFFLLFAALYIYYCSAMKIFFSSSEEYLLRFNNILYFQSLMLRFNR